MQIFRVLFLALMIATSLTAPAPNDSVTTYVPLGVKVKYAPEPRGRGTLGIIFTCMATFFFCVWTAVHPDIVADTSSWCRLYYRSMLMLIAALVPEGLMICAFSQRREAGRLLHRLTKEPGVSGKSLGMCGAFFVVMGGFVVVQGEPKTNAEVTSISSNPTPSSMGGDPAQPPKSELPKPPPMGKKFTLTPNGFLHYLKDGTIKEMSFGELKRSILDKGKTSNIAKVIAGGQALWLFLKCLSRWIAGLPLTLLEVHVMIQVICTVVTYACWWSKPLDVNEPIEIAVYLTDEPRKDLAKPLVDWSRRKERGGREEGEEGEEIAPRTWVETSLAVTAKACYDIAMCIAHEEDHRKNTIVMFVEGILTVVTGTLHAAAWRFQFPSTVETWFWRGSSLGMCFFPMVLVLITVFTEYQKDLVKATLQMQSRKSGLFRFIWDCLVEMHEVAQQHAHECNKQNPSQCPSNGHSSSCQEHYKRSFPKHVFLIWACLSCISAYVLCITFITVEAFLSMRDQPEGVYLTPKWTDYLPFL